MPALRALPAAAVALAGLVALGAQLWVESGVPTDGDWRAAAAQIAAEAQTDDLVLLAPAWAEQGRLYLQAPRVEAWPAIVPEDLVRARRVWLLSLVRAPFAHLERIEAGLAAAGARAIEDRRQGVLRVRRYQLPPRPPLLFDFTAALGEATVAAGQEARPCARDGRGWARCSGAGWNFVGAGDFEIDFAARRCVWAHPIGPRAEPIAITWPAAPLGKWIRLRAGIVGLNALDGAAAPVDVEVQVDGGALGALSVASLPGFRSFAVDTSRAPAGPHAVTFLVSSANPGYRQLCFDAWAE